MNEFYDALAVIGKIILISWIVIVVGLIILLPFVALLWVLFGGV